MNENIPDPIGDFYRWYAEYLRKNEDEAIEFLLTGKVGDTLIACPECRKRLEDE